LEAIPQLILQTYAFISTSLEVNPEAKPLYTTNAEAWILSLSIALSTLSAAAAVYSLRLNGLHLPFRSKDNPTGRRDDWRMLQRYRVFSTPLQMLALLQTLVEIGVRLVALSLFTVAFKGAGIIFLLCHCVVVAHMTTVEAGDWGVKKNGSLPRGLNRTLAFFFQSPISVLALYVPMGHIHGLPEEDPALLKNSVKSGAPSHPDLTGGLGPIRSSSGTGTGSGAGQDGEAALEEGELGSDYSEEESAMLWGSSCDDNNNAEGRNKDLEEAPTKEDMREYEGGYEEEEDWEDESCTCVEYLCSVYLDCGCERYDEETELREREAGRGSKLLGLFALQNFENLFLITAPFLFKLDQDSGLRGGGKVSIVQGDGWLCFGLTNTTNGVFTASQLQPRCVSAFEYQALLVLWVASSAIMGFLLCYDQPETAPELPESPKIRDLEAAKKEVSRAKIRVLCRIGTDEWRATVTEELGQSRWLESWSAAAPLGRNPARVHPLDESELDRGTETTRQSKQAEDEEEEPTVGCCSRSLHTTFLTSNAVVRKVVIEELAGLEKEESRMVHLGTIIAGTQDLNLDVVCMAVELLNSGEHLDILCGERNTTLKLYSRSPPPNSLLSLQGCSGTWNKWTRSCWRCWPSSSMATSGNTFPPSE